MAWAARPADEIWSGSLRTLWTSSLVHVDVVHVTFNTYWLVKLGRPLESALGPLRFAALLLAASFVASSSELAWSAQTAVGMSGVIYAIAGVLWFAKSRYPYFRDLLTFKTWGLLLVWLVMCFFSDLVGFPVANAAHLAGLLLGTAVGSASLEKWKAVGRVTATALVVCAGVSIAWAPWNPSWHIHHGDLALDRGDLKRAREHALSARHGNEVGRALWLLAEVSLRENRIDEAGSLFLDAVKRLPTYHEGPPYAGVLMLKAGKCRRAEQLFAVAAEQRPGHPQTLIGMGRVQECLGNPQVALEHYSSALESSPNHAEAAAYRGWLSLSLNRAPEALIDFAVAAQDTRQSENALQGRMYAELKRGNLEGALEASKKRFSVRSRAAVHPAQGEHCLVLFQLGRMREALEACNETTRAELDDFGSNLVALVLLANDNLADGLAQLRKGATLPDHLYAGLWLAVLANEDEPLRAMKTEGWRLELKRFALGEIDSDTLIERTLIGPEDERQGRRCDAFTFSGARAEMQNQAEDAISLYEAALETQENTYLANAYARWRLRVLRDR